MPSRRHRGRRLAVVLAAVLVIVSIGAYGLYRVSASRSFQIAGDLTQRFETSAPIVALTFDDGPTARDASAILDVLAAKRVHATFYVTGSGAAATPETMRRILADGHEIGNHTWNHRRMVLVSPSTVAREVESTDAAIRGAGYTGAITFRPPYGKKLVALPRYLAEHGRRTVTWDVAVEDFSGAAQGTAAIVDETVAGVHSGSIVLLHPWNGRTATQQAIGPVIDRLRARGYRFVTVSEGLREAPRHES